MANGATATITNGNQNQADDSRARELAARYRCEFIDLREHSIDHDLLRSIPVDLMFRYHFVPLRGYESTLEIAISDPSQLLMVDEVSLLLNKRLRLHVATLSQINELLKRT